MMNTTLLIPIAFMLSISGGLLAAEAAEASPAGIREVAGATLNPDFQNKLTTGKPATTTLQKLQNPTVLASLRDAADCLSKETLENIAKTVDFKSQQVLVFAWSGSGQDQISMSILKSMPPQVLFHYRAGRTRDLKAHAAVYVLPADIQWSLQAQPQIIRCGVE